MDDSIQNAHDQPPILFMWFPPFVYSLLFQLGLFGLLSGRFVRIPDTARSAQSWNDTLKPSRQTNFKQSALSDPAPILDPTIKNRVSGSDNGIGKSLIASSDCRACHHLSVKAVGPSFTEIAQRYRDDKNATSKLANKIINGSRGVWGDQMMSAHPQLTKEEAIEMVTYILSVSN